MSVTAHAHHTVRAGNTLISRMAIVAGFGNPLLDITIKIEDDWLLRKYNLKMDDQSEMTENEMKSLLEDIKNFPTTRTLGGSAQNTLRVLQWLSLHQKCRTYMIGAIGNDTEGEYIKKLVAKEGVITLYSVSQKKSTGVTVALVKNVTRSLVAYIGAAETFTICDFQKVTENGALIKNADLFYIEGFFITERHDVTSYIIQYALANKKLLVYNLSAAYVCIQNSQLVKHIVDNCNILFGNFHEFQALIDIYEPGSNPIDFALKLNKSNDRNSTFRYGKMILITDGPNPVTCIYGDGEKSIIPTVDENLPQEKVKDTTGAGDAFVAGFIAGLFQNYSPEKCVRYGSWAALQIIQQVACKTPDYSPDFK